MSSLTHYLKRLWFASANLSNETLAPDDKVHQMGVIYGIYRILVSVFLVLAVLTADKSIITQGSVIVSETVKKSTLIGYVVIAVVLFVTFYISKANERKQLLIGFLIDMIALTLLLYSGGVTDLQIVLLYMVVIAASFMLLRLSRAVMVTFLAMLSLLYQQVYIIFTDQTSFLSLTDTIMLSLCLLAVGFLSWSVSQRLSTAEAAAQSDARQIARLSTINQAVITNMTDGILVISRSGRLIIINKAAETLLGLQIPAQMTGRERIFEVERQLNLMIPELCNWYKNTTPNLSFELSTKAHDSDHSNHLRVNKRLLPEYGQLLIVEDIMRERTHAQQLKLASLGHLTASIAHEVRNPLGAISQASQILMEDDDCENNPNKELYEMIYFHAKRVNRIIEDIMRLSRQEPPKQEIIVLADWLQAFISQHFGASSISIHLTDSHALLAFDPHHLEQIFINLINNALRHTISLPNTADVQIMVHSNANDVMIDVLDNGEGVSVADQEHLFNPFFTTSKGGTGLGLYLSLAFSEANQAKLIYAKDTAKTCFRLISAKSNVEDLRINLG